MARKLFFSKRRRLPVFLQLYLAWVVLVAITIPIVWLAGSYKAPQLDIEKTKREFYQAPFIINLLKQSENYYLPDQKSKTFSLLKRYITKARYAFRNLEIKAIENGNCRNLRIRKPGKNTITVLVSFTRKDMLTPLYSAIALAEYANTYKGAQALEVIFYDSEKSCGFVEKWLTEVDIKKQAATVLFSGFSTKAKLEMVGSDGITASPDWLSFFDSLNQERLFNQVAISAIPLFQTVTSSLISAGLKAIGLRHSTPDKTLNYQRSAQYTLSIISLVNSINKDDSYGLENRSFWLSKDSALKRGSYFFIVFLGILLIWFPVANQVYLSSGNINIVESLVSALYFAIVPFFTWLSLNLLEVYVEQIMAWSMAAIVLAASFFFMAIRVFKKLLFFKVNVVSSLVILNILLVILSFLNSPLFMILTPIPIFFSRIKNSERFKSLFLLIVGLVPLILFFWSGLTLMPETLKITPDYLLDSIVTDFSSGLLLCLLIGSIFSLINRQPASLHDH